MIVVASPAVRFEVPLSRGDLDSRTGGMLGRGCRVDRTDWTAADPREVLAAQLNRGKRRLGDQGKIERLTPCANPDGSKIFIAGGPQTEFRIAFDSPAKRSRNDRELTAFGVAEAFQTVASYRDDVLGMEGLVPEIFVVVRIPVDDVAAVSASCPPPPRQAGSENWIEERQHEQRHACHRDPGHQLRYTLNRREIAPGRDGWRNPQIVTVIAVSAWRIDLMELPSPTKTSVGRCSSISCSANVP